MYGMRAIIHFAQLDSPFSGLHEQTHTQCMITLIQSMTHEHENRIHAWYERTHVVLYDEIHEIFMDRALLTTSPH